AGRAALAERGGWGGGQGGAPWRRWAVGIIARRQRRVNRLGEQYFLKCFPRPGVKDIPGAGKTASDALALRGWPALTASRRRARAWCSPRPSGPGGGP